jgi:adenylate cyclase
MNYEALTKAYWNEQLARVADLRRRIAARTESILGRLAPDDDSLVIGTGRFLKVAVMFLDVSAFSARASETQSEQETLLRAMNLFFSEMTRTAEDYGGTVEKNTGDGLMAYFEDGAGNPSETGCKRAVACALTMLAANQYLIAPIMSASGIQPFEFRVAIDYGPVTIARLGTPRRFNANVAIGTTANIANKMLALAGPEEILIGNHVKQALPFEWQVFWTKVYEGDSGWTYRLSGTPYLIHRYTGRWKSVE